MPPPPLLVALLLLIVLPVIVTVAPSLLKLRKYPPPKSGLVTDELSMLPVTIELVMLTVLWLPMTIPAPDPPDPGRELPALLALIVLSLILRTIPAVTMEIPPPLPADRLLVTIARLSVRFVVAVSRRIPLPETFVVEFPCRIVASLITTAVAAVRQWITLSLAVSGKSLA